jgi:hypothetical protein
MRTTFLFENLTGRDHSEDLGIDGRVILKCILAKYVLGCELDYSESG